MALKGKRRAKQARSAFHERETLTLGNEPGRNLLTIVFLEERLVVEEIDLRRCPCHEEIDDLFRLHGNLRCDSSSRLREHGIGLRREREQPLAHERRQRQGSDAKPCFAEEVTTCDLAKRFVGGWSSLVVHN